MELNMNGQLNVKYLRKYADDIGSKLKKKKNKKGRLTADEMKEMKTRIRMNDSNVH